MKMQYNLILFFAILLTCLACESTAPDTRVEGVLTSQVIETPVVENIRTSIKYTPLAKKHFVIPVNSTGTIVSTQHTTIHLRAGGIVEQLPIVEGQYIPEGSLIASVNDEAIQLALEQEEINLREAIIKKNDMLISNNGDPDVDTSVTPRKLDIILSLSGVRNAEQAIKKLKFEQRETKIYAPFGGLVADLEIRQHQHIGAGEEVCRLINPNSFEAEFLLTETEAIQVKKGQRVKVAALAALEKSFSAKISVINPIVNEQGLLRVRARLKNTGKQQLFEGMNVRVAIQRRIPNQLVIPKEAVVLRSGRPVVFTYDKETKLAKWNYVEVGEENEKELLILSGLKSGDLVIYEGNLNLAHDAKVTLADGMNEKDI